MNASVRREPKAVSRAELIGTISAMNRLRKLLPEEKE